MSDLDPTFRQYTSHQAASYASHRRSYSKSLYEHIVRYHSRTGNGVFDMLVDVGCGPGGATRDLAAYFSRAIGVDPGDEMIAQAISLGGTTATGNKVEFQVAGAERLERIGTLEPSSVDLISSGMAAHWFRMEDFWPQAARFLKPGGTVALWTQSSLYCHPSTPNASAVQQALSNLEDNILEPYELPSNRLSRTMYNNLTLPWDLTPPVKEFSRPSFVRMEWNRDGRLEPQAADFFGGSDEVTLAELGESLGTASMVTRWREANPDLAHSDKDCVNVTMRTIAKAMDVEHDQLSQPTLRVASATALLLVTKV